MEEKMHLMDGHLPWRSTFFHSSPDSPPPQKKLPPIILQSFNHTKLYLIVLHWKKSPDNTLVGKSS